MSEQIQSSEKEKEKEKEIEKYIAQMDETHRKAYLIAKKHLGTSFNIYRSNGFKEWKSKGGI